MVVSYTMERHGDNRVGLFVGRRSIHGHNGTKRLELDGFGHETEALMIMGCGIWH